MIVNAIIDLLKILRPASVVFLVIVLALGVALSIGRRGARRARWYFTAVLLAYWMFSTPACADRLVALSGNGFHSIATREEARGANVVIVLGSGSKTYRLAGREISQISWDGVYRVLEGARIYAMLDHPTVVVSGGVTSHDPDALPESEVMRDVILRLGVPADHIVLESTSKTTHDEAVILRRMLADRVSQPVVIVTSAPHMRRSVATFRAVGFDPVPSTAPFASERHAETMRWLPDQGALLISDLVAYDTAASLYYWLRGWAPR